MNSNWKMFIGLAMGTVLGAAGVQGLHAQAKLKAYTVTELQTLDPSAAAGFAVAVAKVQESAGGRNLGTGGGRVVTMEGSGAPQRVAITEWESLEKAEAFFKSKAWSDLGPQRDKALKTIRRYAVEVRN
jgi:uncharacterized protein (DUF1330 family)